MTVKLKFLLIFLNILSLIEIATLQTAMGPDVWVDNVCYCIPIGSCTNNMTTASSNAAATTTSSGSQTTTKTVVTTTAKLGNQTIATTSTTRTTTSTIGTTTRINRRPDLEQSDGSLDARIGGSGSSNIGNVVDPSFVPVTAGIKPVVNNQTSCADGLELCCPTNGYGCGMRYPPVASAPYPTDDDQSSYGEYPWEVVIISSKGEFIGGGVLIHNRYALTVAHKIYYSYNIKIRLGEWNTNSTVEPFPPQEFPIADNDVIFHPNFTSLKTLRNDIAILKLPSPGVNLGAYPTISTACLPNKLLNNEKCWVTGWGAKNFSDTSNYQSILKEINLPLVNQSTCETQLRATRLGKNFTLDRNSFVCAGGEEGIDVCMGDGGNGLVCSVNGRFYLYGLVAWGIACGSPNVPGVYVNVLNFIPWIQSTIRNLEGVSSSSATTVTTITPKINSTNNNINTTVKTNPTAAATTVKNNTTVTTVKTNATATTTVKSNSNENSTASTVKAAANNTTTIKTTPKPGTTTGKSTVKNNNNNTTKATTKPITTTKKETTHGR